MQPFSQGTVCNWQIIWRQQQQDGWHGVNEQFDDVQCDQVWLALQMSMCSSSWHQAARHWAYDLYSKVSYQVNSCIMLLVHDGFVEMSMLMCDVEHLTHDAMDIRLVSGAAHGICVVIQCAMHGRGRILNKHCPA